ncbi:glycosyltransferase family 2 protein [Patescibacteria group bacterium]|nr:glycosyltransferase family 2 protein [Patescibacteria group bacterium]
MSTIGIIIPTYNNEKEIYQCLDSIFKQSFNDFEIVIVNDGSTDNTLNEINKYIDQLDQVDKKKIKVISQENKGSNPARNRGAKEIKNVKYVLFCDADVTLNKNFLQLTNEVLENHPEKSYCYTSFVYGYKKFKLYPFNAEKLKKMPYINTQSLIRFDHFPGFDENIKRLQDWDLFLTMLEQSHEGIWLDKVMFKISTKSGKISGKWLPSFMYKLPFLKTVKEYNKAVEIIKQKHHL